MHQNPYKKNKQQGGDGHVITNSTKWPKDDDTIVIVEDDEDDEKQRQQHEKNNSPIVVVTEPKKSDILCGKDKSCVSHEGSVRFRRIIDQYRDRYCSDSTSKQEKMNITKEIVSKLSRSSRFLKYDCKQKVWKTISALAARDKVSHALRFANFKENRRTGKVKHIRRRVSTSSTSSSSNPKTPSPEDIKLWNSFVSRQTKLLESIKKGEKPLDMIPIFVELPETPIEPTAVSNKTNGDLDPLSINDSSFEGTPAFQDYCLQLYRSEENGKDKVKDDEEQLKSANGRHFYSTTTEDAKETNADVFTFDDCGEEDHYPDVVGTDNDSQSQRSESCAAHSENSSTRGESDYIGDDITSIITEPLMAWDLEHDGIFEV